MIIKKSGNKSPRFGRRVFLADNVVIIGDVRLGDDVSLWYGVIVRGDIHWIEIGDRSNLQDGVIVHVENQLYPTRLEEEVSVGHGAVLHGCTIRRGCLIGMNATILNNSDIGAESLVAAGAVVREGFKCPPGSLIAGVPAVVKRELTTVEKHRCQRTASNYLEYKTTQLSELGVESSMVTEEGAAS